MSEGSYRLRRNTVPRFDDSQWRLYQSPDSIIMLTAVGRKLVAQKGISTLLHRYIADARENRESFSDTRQYFAAGGNARVFSVRSPLKLAIKEANPDAADADIFASMSRMDKLKGVVEESCPRWLDIPDSYGVLIDRATNRHFLLMERIDHGVTVRDVLNYGQTPRSDYMEVATTVTFGNVTPELQTEVADRFKRLTGLLRQGLMSQHLSPDEFLPDLDHKPDNVVIEKLNAPIAGSSIRYWVIDQ